MAGATRGSGARSNETSREPVGASQRLGQSLRRVRLTSGWTLEEAAENFGLDLKHLQKVEAGGQNVTLATLERIGAGLGVNIGAILEAAMCGRWPRGRGSLEVQEPAPAPPVQAGEKANPAVPPTDALERVGARLAELRRASRLTQRALADRAAVPLNFVQRAEAGRIRKLTVQRLVRFADVLDVDLADLFATPRQPYRRTGRPNRVT